MSLFAPLFLTSFYIKMKISDLKNEVRERIESGIEESQLSLLTFTLEKASGTLRWEHDREFEYDGIMYDVVKSDTVGNMVFFWCWKDHRESELNKQLEELAGIAMNKDPIQKENQKKINHFLRCLYYESQSFSPAIFDETDIYRNIIGEIFESLIITPPTPPPVFA
jgi:hypothetical protein